DGSPGKGWGLGWGGDREALISATRQLVEQRGAENFTLADACRVAGVTTAAPYRHFREQTAVLRLMFGREPSLKSKRSKIRGDAQEIALRFAASLLIDQDYEAVARKLTSTV